MRIYSAYVLWFYVLYKKHKGKLRKKERKKIKVIFCFYWFWTCFFFLYSHVHVCLCIIFIFLFVLFVLYIYICILKSIWGDPFTSQSSIYVKYLNLFSFRFGKEENRHNTSLRIQLIWGTESILYIKWFSKRKVVVNFYHRVITSICYFKVGR